MADDELSTKEVTYRTAEHITDRTRTEIATELRKALGKEKPIKALTKDLMAHHLALLEKSGLDKRENDDE